MILYSDRDDHYSQRVRIVLAEKDITAEIKESKPEETPEDILSISPYHKLPILVDRDLAIHDPSVMMEYLDERFPHPPLMPVDPVIRAKTRMVLHYIEKDLYGLLDDIKSSGEKKSSAAKLKLKKVLIEPSKSVW